MENGEINMSTELIEEDENKGYNLTRFWNGEGGIVFQITQKHNYSHVELSKKDIEYILKKIKENEK